MKRPLEKNREDAERLQCARGEVEGVHVELTVGSREENQQRAGGFEERQRFDRCVVDVGIGGVAREDLLPGMGGVSAVEEEERSLVGGENHNAAVIVHRTATNRL